MIKDSHIDFTRKNSCSTGVFQFNKKINILILFYTFTGKTSSSKSKSQHVIGEDVHPYLRQLEQALELEIKYRVPIGDNPAGEMSGGITSGMRDGSAHVLRCLKVKIILKKE